jgi:hypothetical protein
MLSKLDFPLKLSLDRTAHRPEDKGPLIEIDGPIVVGSALHALKVQVGQAQPAPAWKRRLRLDAVSLQDFAYLVR